VRKNFEEKTTGPTSLVFLLFFRSWANCSLL
jgi:hypothetical protein